MRVGQLAIGAVSLLAWWPLAAQAAGEAGAGHASELIFLAQITVLLVSGRLLGEFMQRLGQPSIMGQLMAGILLGPSVFGALLPNLQHSLFPPRPEQKAMLDAVSQLGILLLLLLTGMETDLALVRRVRHAALSVSVTGVAIPFVLGFALGEFLPASLLPKPDLRLITSLFLGTALSISSVKIVAMVVREMGFLRRKVGQVIVASAIIDDTIGWVIIAITFSLALHGQVDLWSLGQSLVGTALFLVLSFTLGQRLVFLVIRWTNDNLVSEAAVITAILVIMGLMALVTHAIGVHTVLGAFMAGLLVGQSPILTRQIDEQLRGLITALFAPVFFGLAGLSADLTVLRDPHLLLLTVALVAVASLGKFAGAFAGGVLGRLHSREALALACGMNARGSTEVIVATIGLSIGALSQNLFTMIVAMAVITTLAMPPMLRWALARLPLDEAERQRLEREAFEERGFVPNLERLLVTADQTAKGRFASRLAGLIAGARSMPVTVIRLGSGTDAAGTPRTDLPGVVRSTAEAVQARAAEQVGQIAPGLDVLEQSPETPLEDAVAEEARKGYDLLVVGIEPTTGPGGGFNAVVSRVAGSFEGPLAIVAARGTHILRPEEAPLDILVPINGTEISRRGLEVALTLARASGTPVTALHVSSEQGAGKPSRRLNRWAGLRRGDGAVLKEAATLADRYGVALRTMARSGITVGDAVLRQARLGQHTLLVLGVTRRSGEILALGPVADAVLEASDRSVMFLAS
ncbi:cation:proton antiporter [Methylobacterium nodulans]|uniref:Sodium/hydrogen exchanger n=1 Tax=Methylobacterium nodulans (strain LMG 21967 / CNCM I-2342 / ORS 2060) TaxID=460265 RepID=B8IJJ7_METNO|nr:cation:proton antiporter [Methylobacterium nodulans]ACL58045.1 sodium/hydrogen exchanger [Methylobacterium nodulans ORS 2060]